MSTQVNHRGPKVGIFVWQVYNQPGLTQREMAKAIELPYFNLNKRSSRLERQAKGLVVFRDHGYWPTRKLTPAGARRRLRRLIG